ncbi:MAG TPA: quinate 5-dehydrogenase [Firmicutes bacterium]|nr:quinate 5-dehydrogenase [Bacillota bacterium]
MDRRRLLGVSLGSSARDFSAEWRWPGGTVEIRRAGTDGDVGAAARLLAQYDGRVDALALGGVNFCYRLGRRSYPIPTGLRLKRVVKNTLLCDGSYVKAWWEPWALSEVSRWRGLNFAGRKVLFSSALDRWQLAASLEDLGARVWLGDGAFALGLPILFPGLGAFSPFAAAALPVLRHLPLSFLYPASRPAGGKGRWAARRACARTPVLAGDLHFFRGCLPARLDGKWVIGSGLTADESQELVERGVELVMHLEPVLETAGGRRGLSANLAEAVVAAAAGQHPEHMGERVFLRLCSELGFAPAVVTGAPPSVAYLPSSPAKANI